MHADQLLLESQKYTQLTPMEVEILFAMSALERNDGCITYKEVEKISPLHEGRMVYTQHAQPPVRCSLLPPACRAEFCLLRPDSVNILVHVLCTRSQSSKFRSHSLIA